MIGKSLLKKVASRLGHSSGAEVAVTEKEASFYDKLYTGEKGYHSHYAQSHYYFLWAVIADRIEHSDIKSVLEIGCGPGQLASMLMSRGLPKYCGMDFSPTAIELARKNCPNGRFEVGDARVTDLHQTVDHDLVICTEVLEHIDDDLVVLSKFKPGTRCICTVPSFPYESHVRHFDDAEQVIARYGRYFTDLKVSTWVSSKYIKDRFYLMDGHRSDFVG